MNTIKHSISGLYSERRMLYFNSPDLPSSVPEDNEKDIKSNTAQSAEAYPSPEVEITMDIDQSAINFFSQNEEKFLFDNEAKKITILDSDVDINLNSDGLTAEIEMYATYMSERLEVIVTNSDGTRDFITLNYNGTYSIENSQRRVNEIEPDNETDSRLSQIDIEQNEFNISDGGSSAPHTVADVLQKIQGVATGVEGQEWNLPEAGAGLAESLPEMYAEVPNLTDVMSSEVQIGGVDKVNEFLVDEGFSIQLESIAGPDDIAAASVLDIGVEWLQAGESGEMRLSDSNGQIDYDSEKVDSVTMSIPEDLDENEARPFFTGTVEGHEHPIAVVRTAEGYLVCMTRLDEAPEGSTDLHSLAESMTQNSDFTNEYGAISFPMVDFHREGDINEILGAELGKYKITEAKYEHMLRMNENGARAQAAAAAVASKGMDEGPPKLYIDGPFLVWFWKSGDSDENADGIIPFVAHVQRDDMNSP